MSGSSDASSTAQERFLAAVREGQEAMLAAVRTWADSVQALTGQRPAAADRDQLPSLTEVVDNAYQFAQDLLASQHQLARSVAEAMAAPFEAAAKSQASRGPAESEREPGSAKRGPGSGKPRAGRAKSEPARRGREREPTDAG